MKKRLFHNKKGITHQQLILLVELVLPFIIFVILMSWVNSVTTNQNFDKNYIARETALLTSSIYAGPGNIFYKYATDKYIFNFDNNQVKIELPDNDRFPISYPYRKNNNIKYILRGIRETQNSLSFLKSNNNIQINKNLEIDTNKLICPVLDTSKISSLGIDPWEILIPDDITLDITKSIQANLPHLTILFSRYDTGIKRDIDFIKSKNVIIGLRVGDYKSTKNHLKAYYSLTSSNYQKSQKLACHILNQFSENFDSLAVIGINPIDFTATQQEKILNNDKIAVILEIGSVNNPKNKDLLKKPGEIAALISQGIKEYETQ